MKRLLIFLWLGTLAGCGGGEPETTFATHFKRPLNPSTIIPVNYERLSDSLYCRELSRSTGGETRFEIVHNSGVEFANQLDRDTPKQYIETGSGVALADYDNDGLIDVYLVATDGPNKLFRCVGDFKFEDVTNKASVSGAVDGKDVWGAGASFADIDNDGDLDLFVCNVSARNILYANNGDGTFTDRTKEAGLDYDGASKVGSFCDYDRDGDLDLYLLTYQDKRDTRPCKFVQVGDMVEIHPDYRDSYSFLGEHVVEGGERDVLYANNGDGTFDDVTRDAQLIRHEMGLSIAWFDYNNDGWQDIYLSADYWHSDHLLENKQDGTFQDVLPQLVRHSPWYSKGCDTGDLNNDGWEDLMVGDISPQTHKEQMLKRGDLDTLAWFLDFTFPRQSIRNGVYINTGTNRFMETAYQSGLASTGWTWAVRFADLDNDGLLDIFVTNGNARDSMNTDRIVMADRLLQEGDQAKLNDFNNATPPLKEKNVAFKNKGDFEFTNVADDWNLALEGISHGVAFADFDFDGDLDMVVNNLGTPATVYRNLGGAGNRLLVELRSLKNNLFGYGTKVEIWHGKTHQSRTLTPVRGYISSDPPIVHFGLNTADKVDRMRVTWPDGSVQESTDLKTNRLYRVLEKESEYVSLTEEPPTTPLFVENATGTGMDFQHVEEPFDDFQREPMLPYKQSQLGPGVAWGDINNDGLPDAYIGGSNFQVGRMFVNRGGEKFERLSGPWQDAFRIEEMGALFLDADNDADLDLFVVSGGNEAQFGSFELHDKLYLNQGDETFEKAPMDSIPALGDSGSCVAAGDLDRDGDLDLFVGSRCIPGQFPLVSGHRLLRNRMAKFTDVTNQLAEPLAKVGMVNSAMWSDYDQDGWVDLILAVDWGPITVFKNTQGKLVDVTQSLGLDKYKGLWHGLAAGDFDGDGDTDYVATNQGLNTQYRADPKHPHRLYFPDFDNNGTTDLVESQFEGSQEYPVLARSYFAKSLPSIGDRFPTNIDFAKATVSELFGQLEGKPVLEVNHLETSIFWNDGSKGMRIEPLPRMAQISPGFGVDVNDFDADGQLDILLVHNFFGAQSETGIMDGGLGVLLIGDGRGSFEPVPPQKSGVLLPFDSMGLATADYDADGDLDALVGVNQAMLVLLKNESNPPSFFEVRLKGRPRNSEAIGSQVNIEYVDGTQRHFEIRAGGSYLSQSTSSILLPGKSANDVKTIRVLWPNGVKTTWEPKPDSENRVTIVNDDLDY